MFEPKATAPHLDSTMSVYSAWSALSPPVDQIPIPAALLSLPVLHTDRPRGSKPMADVHGARQRLADCRPGAWLISPYTGWKWAKWYLPTIYLAVLLTCSPIGLTSRFRLSAREFTRSGIRTAALSMWVCPDEGLPLRQAAGINLTAYTRACTAMRTDAAVAISFAFT